MENYQRVDHNNKMNFEMRIAFVRYSFVCLLAYTFWSIDWLTNCLPACLPGWLVNAVVFHFILLYFLMGPFTWPYKHEILVISAISMVVLFRVLDGCIDLLLTNWIFAHVSGFVFDNNSYGSNSKYKHFYFIWFNFSLSFSFSPFLLHTSSSMIICI